MFAIAKTRAHLSIICSAAALIACAAPSSSRLLTRNELTEALNGAVLKTVAYAPGQIAVLAGDEYFCADGSWAQTAHRVRLSGRYEISGHTFCVLVPHTDRQCRELFAAPDGRLFVRKVSQAGDMPASEVHLTPREDLATCN